MSELDLDPDLDLDSDCEKKKINNLKSRITNDSEVYDWYMNELKKHGVFDV